MMAYVITLTTEAYDSNCNLENRYVEIVGVVKNLKEAIDFVNTYPLVNVAPTDFDQPLADSFWVSSNGRARLQTVGTWSLSDSSGKCILDVEEFELE